MCIWPYGADAENGGILPQSAWRPMELKSANELNTGNDVE
tara:strand:+ start:99 stop:218 length:120 start_codon:yes stop_codon:yes gene_type:complete